MAPNRTTRLTEIMKTQVEYTAVAEEMRNVRCGICDTYMLQFRVLVGRDNEDDFGACTWTCTLCKKYVRKIQLSEERRAAVRALLDDVAPVAPTVASKGKARARSTSLSVAEPQDDQLKTTTITIYHFDSINDEPGTFEHTIQNREIILSEHDIFAQAEYITVYIPSARKFLKLKPTKRLHIDGNMLITLHTDVHPWQCLGLGDTMQRLHDQPSLPFDLPIIMPQGPKKVEEGASDGSSKLKRKKRNGSESDPEIEYMGMITKKSKLSSDP
ncbi:hypothetical protein VNI00_006794 [Paramarasmius palmivorus]|uniref:Uncharacterized protein n=1 Tax=Paramarasmius palmivorus TaxID=297713 RepID=A0AAW0D920_9AGAR